MHLPNPSVSKRHFLPVEIAKTVGYALLLGNLKVGSIYTIYHRLSHRISLWTNPIPPYEIPLESSPWILGSTLSINNSLPMLDQNLWNTLKYHMTQDEHHEYYLWNTYEISMKSLWTICKSQLFFSADPFLAGEQVHRCDQCLVVREPGGSRGAFPQNLFVILSVSFCFDVHFCRFSISFFVVNIFPNVVPQTFCSVRFWNMISLGIRIRFCRILYFAHIPRFYSKGNLLGVGLFFFWMGILQNGWFFINNPYCSWKFSDSIPISSTSFHIINTSNGWLIKKDDLEVPLFSETPKNGTMSLVKLFGPVAHWRGDVSAFISPIKCFVDQVMFTALDILYQFEIPWQDGAPPDMFVGL